MAAVSTETTQRVANPVTVNKATLDFLAGAPKQLLINGKWVPSKSGKTFDAVNPATEEVIARVAEGDKADVEEAVKAARKAFDDGKWSGMNPHHRARYLLKVADLIEQHADELATMETLNNGMAISLARGMVSGAVDTFRYYAGWATKIYGETNPSDPAFFNYTLREPVGVCGQIIPWNGPIAMLAWKIAPALACGNISILKPAEQTPLTALRIGELLLEAGIPDGVVNIITGFGETAGAAIANHPDIDKVAFTGSTEVGKLILQASAGNLKRVSLELGGKSANIILDDANFEKVITAGMKTCTVNTGQSCNAPTRMLVPNKRMDEAAAIAKAAALSVKVGDPVNLETQTGPVASKTQWEKVQRLIKKGIEEGAKLEGGGEGLPDGLNHGYFVKPTVFSHVKNDMTIAREEIFGPVLSIIGYEDDADAVRIANDTLYGLSGYVQSANLERARSVARQIRAGNVHVNGAPGGGNAPFGGYKQSGNGREFGIWGLEEFLETKAILGYNAAE